MTIWSNLPDPTTLLIYGLLSVFLAWALVITVGAVVEARRDCARWRQSRAVENQHLERALEPDDDQ